MKNPVTLLLLLICTLSLAQNPFGTIVGRATDPAGGVIPGVAIRIVNLDTNQVHSISSGTLGDFTATNLQPGRYSLDARHEGFRPYQRPEFKVAVDQTLRLDVQLELGSTTESVTIRETVEALNTESGARGEVTSSDEIREMPLAGRNFSDLAFLTGGVLPKGTDGDGAFAVNGARADNVGFLVDGMNNTQRRNTGAVVSPPIEGIQEFKVITSGFQAEYGSYAGGVLSVVLKSGGNRPHGSVYEFIRNDIFDARNFFDLDKSKLRRNQFGGTLSGPVVLPKIYNGRDRTFFLLTWESIRQVAGTTKRAQTPLPEMLQGNFAASIDANGKPQKILDPLARSAPFPNNAIPLARLDPVSVKLAQYYPKPNLTSLNNYIAQGNTTSEGNNYTIKADHSFGPRDQFSARTVWNPNQTSDPFTRSFIPVFGTATQNFSLLSGLRYTRTISARLIAELSASFSRRTLNQAWPDSSRDWSGEAGFTGGTTSPVAMGIPQVDVTGFVILGHPYDLPKIWSYNNYQYSAAMTWIHGRHTIKYGGEFLRYQYFSRQYGYTRGRLTFLGRFTNDPFADFMLGYAQTTRRQLDAGGPYHLLSSYGAYVQDDFKVTSRLTLNLGLRYELQKPPLEKFGAWSMFVPSVGKIVMAGQGTLPDFNQRIQETGLANFVTMASDAGLPQTLTRPDYNDFAPRFGFAWRPFGGTRTVLRGGYGIFYGQSSLYRLDEYSDTYPYAVQESYSATSSNPLALTVSNPWPASKRKVSGVTSTFGQDINGRSQYLQSWNLTLEREFGRGNIVELAYAGSKGTHLQRRYDINQPLRVPELKLADGTFPRPFPAFSSINFISAGSNSSYNSAVAAFRRRFSRDLFLRASYTYSKSLDESSNTGGTIAYNFASAQDSRNLKLERGRSDFDIRQSFLASFIWQPHYSNNLLLRNWQLSGTTRAYTGPPFTVRVSNVSLDLGEAVRPDRIASGVLSNPSADLWFDRAAFPSVPRGAYRFGTSGRNILDGPGALSLDLGLSRRFKFGESNAFQFRWETFNVPNRTNLSLPENNVDVLNGGTVISAKSARIHQLGLRFEF